MRKLALLALCCVIAATSPGQAAKHPQAAKPPLAQRLKATEGRFAKLAASSQDMAARLDKVEAQLDQLLKTIQSFHKRFR